MFTVEVRDKNEENAPLDEIRDAIVSMQNSGASVVKPKLSLFCSGKNRKKIIERIEEPASRKGLSYTIMSSGAVHDTCLIAAHAPAG